MVAPGNVIPWWKFWRSYPVPTAAIVGLWGEGVEKVIPLHTPHLPILPPTPAPTPFSQA